MAAAVSAAVTEAVTVVTVSPEGGGRDGQMQRGTEQCSRWERGSAAAA